MPITYKKLYFSSPSVNGRATDLLNAFDMNQVLRDWDQSSEEVALPKIAVQLFRSVTPSQRSVARLQPEFDILGKYVVRYLKNRES